MSYGKSCTFRRTTRALSLSLGGALVCLSLLSGCATTGADDAPKANVDILYKDADAALAAGQTDKAIGLWNQAARENPTSAVPWMKMANAWFEQNNYPSAIVAANEAMQRDESNQDVKSVLVVAGLRVAAKAVAGLRPNGAVNMNARAEAEKLTNSLREVLGEKVLVPPATADARPTPAARIRLHSRAHGASKTSKSHQSESSNGSADPFKSLK
ncbi:MAG TPA: tetratricopeptide repeat protein [Noviherbaspirillum sp.]|uniref:tetratricopeptide repeat protein n=1 Tax=Noviherbaspirillum sp. TaxID=1926288 RepID=UPI002B489A73|nr:tetratricopeptide repeat protein [Noviherbaspirillum sp.]HJV85030.1 tetratricopeptide repeat protein [Noviherbaspirillum sp.]